MAWIKTIDEGEAEGPLAELYRSALDPRSGRLDNVLKIHGLHPRGLEAHLALYRAAMRPDSELRSSEREMIAVVVSTLNACHY